MTISAEIEQTATEIAKELPIGGLGHRILKGEVAKALIAAISNEREECAQVIDTLIEVLDDEIADAETNMSRQILSTQRHALQAGAAAIRRREDTKK